MDKFIEIPVTNRSIAMRGKVYGIGINDAPYLTKPPNSKGKRQECIYYKTWQGMLERCYSETYHTKHPTYTACTVCNEWVNFTVFKEWMRKQDWVNKQLDKDILVSGNKEYSPKSCCFIHQSINKLLIDRGRDRGLYPVGVIRNPLTGRYISRCSVNSKRVWIGTYNTQEEASKAYKEYKANHIRRVADTQPINIKEALYIHATNI